MSAGPIQGPAEAGAAAAPSAPAKRWAFAARQDARPAAWARSSKWQKVHAGLQQAGLHLQGLEEFRE
eukprot:6996215-Lingulodinium_polyedra.AAC.1